jgi:hypothetical protein
MIDFNILRGIFSLTAVIGDNILKFYDIIPAFSETLYLKNNALDGYDIILANRNSEDDEFAIDLMSALCQQTISIPMPPYKFSLGYSNRYGFDSVFLVAPDWHGYLQGRCDDARGRLLLALPCHRCEFATTLTRDEFRYFWIHYLNPNWDRTPCPIVKRCIRGLRSRKALNQTDFSLSSYKSIAHDIDIIEHDKNKQWHLVNFENLMCTVKSDHIGTQFTISLDGNTARFTKKEAMEFLDRFLIRGLQV